MKALLELSSLAKASEEATAESLTLVVTRKKKRLTYVRR